MADSNSVTTADAPASDERLNRHRRFWAREDQTRPLVSFRIGDFFFATHFYAALPLLGKGEQVRPESVVPRDFSGDYERMYQASIRAGQDAFWTAEPFTGFPWMEGILGCPVIGGNEAFTSQPIYASVSDAVDGVERVHNQTYGTDAEHWFSEKGAAKNPWLSLYLRFLSFLKNFAQGRFPVGQPILRGVTDMFGAVLGQNQMVFALTDEPELSHRLIAMLSDIFLNLHRLSGQLLDSFYGGSSLGFYHVWSPGPSLWFQDDLSALLSPDLYRRFFLSSIQRFCREYPFNAVHLHSSSFFLLDDLLDTADLKAVEVNVDIGGLSLSEMLPILKKIQNSKSLILWGNLNSGDIRLIQRELNSSGLFLNIVTEDMRDAVELNRLIAAGSRS